MSRTPPPEPEAFPEPQDVGEFSLTANSSYLFSFLTPILHECQCTNICMVYIKSSTLHRFACFLFTDPTQPQILQNLSTSMSNLNTVDTEEVPPISSPSSPPPPAPTLSLTKPVPVRVQPIKSSPPVQRNAITSTSQIKANLQANNGLGRTSKNLASIPPLRQNITPLPGKKSGPTNDIGTLPQPLGPQRSNSTLTPRVAPMAAVLPVMDDGKLKNRAPSPDSPKHYLKRQSSCRDGEQGYESDYPVQ